MGPHHDVTHVKPSARAPRPQNKTPRSHPNDHSHQLERAPIHANSRAFSRRHSRTPHCTAPFRTATSAPLDSSHSRTPHCTVHLDTTSRGAVLPCVSVCLQGTSSLWVALQGLLEH